MRTIRSCICRLLWLSWPLACAMLPARRAFASQLQYALSAIDCVQRHRWYSQKREDRRLLPTLLAAAANGAGGTFVELGAFDGVTFSNTLLLERCFNWTGVLIEANPGNFRKLQESGRSAKIVHSAICKGDGRAGQTVTITTQEGLTAGNPHNFSDAYVSKWYGGDPVPQTIDVPCRSLESIMMEAQLPRVTFLSLDVEGAEEDVLATVDPRRFQAVMVETEGHERATNERIRRLLVASELHEAKWLKVQMSSVFLQSAVPRLAMWDLSPVLAARDTTMKLHMGFCAVTADGEEGNCEHGQFGSWRIGPEHKLKSTGDCYRRCTSCHSCQFVSFNVNAGDCSWFAKCAFNDNPGFDAARDHGQDHYTIEVVKHNWHRRVKARRRARERATK